MKTFSGKTSFCIKEKQKKNKEKKRKQIKWPRSISERNRFGGALLSPSRRGLRGKLDRNWGFNCSQLNPDERDEERESSEYSDDDGDCGRLKATQTIEWEEKIAKKQEEKLRRDWREGYCLQEA